MMAIVPHVTSSSGLRKFQADGFFFTECTRVLKLRSVYSVFKTLKECTPVNYSKSCLVS